MGLFSKITNLFKKKSGGTDTAESKDSEEGKAQAEAAGSAASGSAEGAAAAAAEAKPEAAAASAEEKKPAGNAESAPEASPKKSSRLIDDSIRESEGAPAEAEPAAEPEKPSAPEAKEETEEPAPEAVKVEAEEPAAEPAPAEKAEAAPAAEPAPEKPAKARSTAKKASSAKKKAPAAKKPAGEKTAASAKGTAKKSSAAKKPAAKKTASKKASEPRKPEAEAAAPAAEPDEKAESAKAPAKKAAESKSEEKKPAARKSAAKKAPAPAAEAEPEKKDQAAPAEQEPEKAESVSQTAGTPEAPAAGAEPGKKDQGEPAEAAVTIENLLRSLEGKKDQGEPAEAEPEKSAKKDEPEEPQSRFGLFRRLVSGLSSSGKSIGYGLSALFRGRKIDEELYTDLEERLVMADISYNTAEKILERVKDKAKLKDLRDADALTELVKSELLEILRPVSSPLIVQDRKPFVILMVGVNGAGKTTTIGKMASAFKNKGMEVVLAAGDTFRAAAVEQLNVWGVRNDVRVVAQATGADSASVIFDAYSAAKASGADVLIADTAGRLQNKENLMRELAKIVKVLKKHDPDAPHEVLLTLDAGIGQNAISQVRQFNGTVPVTGICLTKLDGTAKGGVIFSIADEFRIPVRYIGVGEGISDLREFNAGEFIDALFDGGNK